MSAGPADDGNAVRKFQDKYQVSEIKTLDLKAADRTVLENEICELRTQINDLQWTLREQNTVFVPLGEIDLTFIRRLHELLINDFVEEALQLIEHRYPGHWERRIPKIKVRVAKPKPEDSDFADWLEQQQHNHNNR